MKKQFYETSIDFIYNKPSQENINWLKANAKPMPIDQNFRIKSLHSYKDIKLKGVLNLMYTRTALVIKLNQILEHLPHNFSFLIFDAFRTIETQFDLFRYIYEQQKDLHPALSHEELFAITKEFIVHPAEKSLYEIPPHNSGGALDLTLALDGQALNMGTDFDCVSECSQTIWFEQDYIQGAGYTKDEWFAIRKNRRLLFNAMKRAGFVNYTAEWWHYDLGDCHWAKTLDLDWYYPSLESELLE
ncbi:M15 family metallopeptidase [Fluviispira sanaruensis]|uniref:D-alanyl-D-alanine dipeptidase n=1 Tax=Fluviispira sanaruensis TaxID=2493639 RepID=A0A4P2VJE5_FLUSA|nr:M15 family metallopeptidase [Fluviispira sanaruensis]BBH52811.1 D-Ala-D-Ala dipeptidase [Fluviispira sanaruensis]